MTNSIMSTHIHIIHGSILLCQWNCQWKWQLSQTSAIDHWQLPRLSVKIKFSKCLFAHLPFTHWCLWSSPSERRRQRWLATFPLFSLFSEILPHKSQTRSDNSTAMVRHRPPNCGFKICCQKLSFSSSHCNDQDIAEETYLHSHAMHMIQLQIVYTINWEY